MVVHLASGSCSRDVYAALCSLMLLMLCKIGLLRLCAQAITWLHMTQLSNCAALQAGFDGLITSMCQLDMTLQGYEYYNCITVTYFG
jgi:hypothetical protein